MGKAYGFKTMYYWQPVIYYKKKLTNFEEHFTHDDEMKKLYFKTYEVVNKIKPEMAQYNFYDISGIFADSQGSLFIDYCHVNEQGNKEIAERMASDVLRVLKGK